MEFFSTIVHLFVGYVLFSTIFYIVKVYRIVSSPDYIDPEEPEQPQEIAVEFLQQDGQFYMWDKDTGDFITQAATFEGIVENCLKFHRNKIFHIAKEDVEKYNLKAFLPPNAGVGQ